MEVIHRNAEIPVEMIYPHPDNPRKGIGDITELCDSIKANGIFQNLTVVAGGKGVPKNLSDSMLGYTVVIGHRRLAAAIQAGLTRVPCMVADMDEKEQAATMLLENMQRSDLTVLEQAQGFQMMLDLGETQDTIAEKTGFSRSTIRHRLKLLELDPEEFAKAQERQATFSDYIELERIKDPDNKKEALKSIGTPNFKWKVDQMVTRESAGANAEKTLAFLDERLKRIPYEKRFSYRQTGYLPISKELTEARTKEIEELIEKGAKYYTISSEAVEYAWAYIYVDAAAETFEQEEEREKREAEENARRERDRRLTELEARSAKLRKDFVKDFSNREYINTLNADLLLNNSLDDIDYDDVADLLGIVLDEDEDWLDLLTKTEYKDMVKKHPESVMLAMLCSLYEDPYRASLHDFSGRYRKNDELADWYAILTKVGYRMSSEERQLLSGTHECFK